MNPLYQVCFTTATIVASLILFQGLNTDNPVNTISLIVGFIVILIGMHLLELSRKPAVTGHNALEHGILNPRLSLQGRSSIDDWGPSAGAAASPGLNFGHARRSSRNLAAATAAASHAHAHSHAHAPLFDAFEYEDAPPNGSAVHAHAVGLRSLREEESEDDELEAATERTRLRAEERRSRSHSGSPTTGTPGEPWRS